VVSLSSAEKKQRVSLPLGNVASLLSVDLLFCCAFGLCRRHHIAVADCSRGVDVVIMEDFAQWALADFECGVVLANFARAVECEREQCARGGHMRGVYMCDCCHMCWMPLLFPYLTLL